MITTIHRANGWDVRATLEAPPEEEIVVMQAVLDGLKDQTIARRLGISIITVRRRVGRYLDHVGAKNRIQGAVVGVRNGWLRLELERPPGSEQVAQ